MDIVIVIWAIGASLLFIWEIKSHADTKAEFLAFKIEVSLNTVIDEYKITQLKPAIPIDTTSHKDP